MLIKIVNEHVFFFNFPILVFGRSHDALCIILPTYFNYQTCE